jgi:flagellar hook protein FlgE
MAFQQALSGLNVASKSLDVIGNNIANTSTVGYKSGDAQFADVFAASLSGAGSSPVGLGASVATVVQQFTQGNITTTSNVLDIAINGNGFFRMDNNGTLTYSRNGQFQLDANGFIVNSFGSHLTGYAADSAGKINTGALTDLQIDKSSISPQATGTSSTGTGVLADVNLNSSESVPSVTTFSYTNSNSYNKTTGVTVYDSLGNAHSLNLYFVKTAANAWDVYATLTNSAGTTTDLSSGGTTPLGSLSFDSTGNLTGTSSFTQAITTTALGTGAAAMSFPINFAGSTQWGSSFAVNSMSQDGFTVGELTSFSIGDDGVILGAYSNGQSKNLGQVVLASFANPQGLQALGNNQFGATSTSGVAIVGTPQSSGLFGTLQASAVEDSNVDLTAELVRMITAQRNYQANAQTIKTEDQIMQTLVNLR